MISYLKFLNLSDRLIRGCFFSVGFVSTTLLFIVVFIIEVFGLFMNICLVQYNT